MKRQAIETARGINASRGWSSTETEVKAVVNGKGALGPPPPAATLLYLGSELGRANTRARISTEVAASAIYTRILSRVYLQKRNLPAREVFSWQKYGSGKRSQRTREPATDNHRLRGFGTG